jgi:hypothetical protein
VFSLFFSAGLFRKRPDSSLGFRPNTPPGLPAAALWTRYKPFEPIVHFSVAEHLVLRKSLSDQLRPRPLQQRRFYPTGERLHFCDVSVVIL